INACLVKLGNRNISDLSSFLTAGFFNYYTFPVSWLLNYSFAAKVTNKEGCLFGNLLLCIRDFFIYWFTIIASGTSFHNHGYSTYQYGLLLPCISPFSYHSG